MEKWLNFVHLSRCASSRETTYPYLGKCSFEINYHSLQRRTQEILIRKGAGGGGGGRKFILLLDFK